MSTQITEIYRPGILPLEIYSNGLLVLIGRDGKERQYIPWRPDMGPEKDDEVVSDLLGRIMMATPGELFSCAIDNLQHTITLGPSKYDLAKVAGFFVGGVPRVVFSALEGKIIPVSKPETIYLRAALDNLLRGADAET